MVSCKAQIQGFSKTETAVSNMRLFISFRFRMNYRIDHAREFLLREKLIFIAHVMRTINILVCRNWKIIPNL